MVDLSFLFGSPLGLGVNAPEIPSTTLWFNSKPLKVKELTRAKKLIMIDFWTYSCVNCLRTLPYLLHWYEKYAQSGLTIIGVHTPEFEFEKDPHNVKDFLEKEGIKYPVVMDNEYRIWDAFANNCWPRKFLIDSKGKIRYDHSGEGDYSETELKIQELLKEINPSLKFDRVVPEIEHIGDSAVCYPMTPETYCGYSRGILGNPEGYLPDRKYEYHDNEERVDGKIYLRGPWVATKQYLSYEENLKDYQDYLALAFHGLELNAVMESDMSQEVVVTLDDQAVPKHMRGSDLREEKGRTFVLVDQAKMYNIIESKNFGNHVLKLAPINKKFKIYAFTFGGCNH